MQSTHSDTLRKFNVKFNQFVGSGIWRGKSVVVLAGYPEGAELLVTSRYSGFDIKVTGVQELPYANKR